MAALSWAKVGLSCSRKPGSSRQVAAMFEDCVAESTEILLA